MRKPIAGLVAATGAAVVGFVVHVSSQAPVQAWVSAHMEGRSVVPSWDVRYLALLTSLETGIALVLLYSLVRSALPVRSSFGRGLVLAALVLAVMGRLLRQPLMNIAIGNPWPVVLVQDGVSWLVWLCTCVVVTITYDWLAPQDAL